MILVTGIPDLKGIPLEPLKPSLFSRLRRGTLRLHGSKRGLMAHDRDGLVVHEFPSAAEVNEAPLTETGQTCVGPHDSGTSKKSR